MLSLEGEQESWGAESAIAPRLAAARIAWLAENPHVVLCTRSPFFECFVCFVVLIPMQGRSARWQKWRAK